MAFCLKCLICVAGVCLASSVHLRSSASEPAAEHCTCLNWQDVYHNRSTYDIECGQGHEFYHKTKAGYPWQFVKQSAAGDALCPMFFERLPGNTCMNMGFVIDEEKLKEAYDHPQWCYVSSMCAYLNGGLRLTRGVSYKKCVPGEDNTLEAKTPQELMDLQQEADLDIAMLVKMAYPTYPGTDWETARPFYEEGKSWNTTNLTNFTEMQRILMNRIKGWGKHVVFDSVQGHTAAAGTPWYPTLGVIEGNKIFEVEFAVNSSYFSLAAARRHPGKINKFTCKKSCDEHPEKKLTREEMIQKIAEEDRIRLEKEEEAMWAREMDGKQ